MPEGCAKWLCFCLGVATILGCIVGSIGLLVTPHPPLSVWFVPQLLFTLIVGVIFCLPVVLLPFLRWWLPRQP